jgi:hypothetical protein
MQRVANANDIRKPRNLVEDRRVENLGSRAAALERNVRIAKSIEIPYKRYQHCTIPNLTTGQLYHKYRQSQDLKSQSSNHNVVSHCRRTPFMICHRSHAASHRLQNKGHHVAGDEKPSVSLRLYARILGSKGIYDVPDTEIDSPSQEGWCNRQAHNLEQEAGLVPWVGIGDDAS